MGNDYGQSWVSSTPVDVHGECSIAFLVDPSDGRILMNCRTPSHHRAQVVWSADGTPGPVTWPEGLIDPNCQGSIINQAGTLYMSNANTNSSRTHMTVKKSTDQGKTWSAGTLVWSGPSSYSQLVPLGRTTTLGLLFEAAHSSFGLGFMICFTHVNEGEEYQAAEAFGASFGRPLGGNIWRDIAILV